MKTSSFIYVLVLSVALVGVWSGRVAGENFRPNVTMPQRGGGCRVWGGRRLTSINGSVYTVQYQVGLGRVKDDGETGYMSIVERVLTPDSYTPDVLGISFFANGKDTEFVRDPSRPQRVIADPGEKGGYTSQSIKQIRVPETFVDIVVLSEWDYEIRFYHLDQVRPKRSGFYRVAGEPYSVTRVRNPNPPNLDMLEITTTKDGTAEKNEYKYDASTDTWSFFLNGNEQVRKYSQVNPDDPCERIETRYDLKDRDWVKTIKIYKAFPWGQDIVKKIEDPDGQMLTTTYKYWDDPNGPHYTFLKTTIQPDGTIEKHNRHPDPFKNWQRKP